MGAIRTRLGLVTSSLVLAHELDKKKKKKDNGGT
jgi:hypothetical protein